MRRRTASMDFYDPRRGVEPLQIRGLAIDPGDHEPGRTNCFRVYFIESGSGAVAADAARHPFGSPSLIFSVPYQYIRFVADSSIVCRVIAFHANFLCVETFHAETGCGGVLFNDPYGEPLVAFDEPTSADADELIARILRERAGDAMARDEVILASVKILLIVASRLKASRSEIQPVGSGGDEHRRPILGRLRDLIEENYRTSLGPSDYARLLDVSPKTLEQYRWAARTIDVLRLRCPDVSALHGGLQAWWNRRCRFRTNMFHEIMSHGAAGCSSDRRRLHQNREEHDGIGRHDDRGLSRSKSQTAYLGRGQHTAPSCGVGAPAKSAH